MQTKFGPVLFVFLLLTVRLCAQDIAQEKPHRYFNLFQAGGLFGEKDRGTSFTFSTIHGIQLQRVRVGLGLGYDSYQQWRVAPLYAMAAFDIARIKSNALYFSLSGSVGKAWYRRQIQWEPDYEADRAFSFSPMLGYRILADKWNIDISAGYKLQRIDYSYSPEYWGSFQSGPAYSVNQSMERVVIQLGFGLN